MIKLQEFLLDELVDSKNNPGLTLHGETYDNNLYVSMKAFWDQFVGEITLEYTCASCKSTISNREPINYLLLKFPDDNDKKCHTLQSLIKFNLRETDVEDYHCPGCQKKFQPQQSLPLLSFPPSCALYSVAMEEKVMASLLHRLSILPLVSTLKGTKCLMTSQLLSITSQKRW
jgi:DNA-directed RNA polymerase subunit RPC12/RpoP